MIRFILRTLRLATVTSAVLAPFTPLLAQSPAVSDADDEPAVESIVPDFERTAAQPGTNPIRPGPADEPPDATQTENDPPTADPSATDPPPSSEPATEPLAEPPTEPVAPAPPTSEAATRRAELEKQLESLKGLLEAVQKKAEQRAKEQSALQAEIETFRRDGFAEPAPYQLSLLDSIRDSLETETLSKQISEATLDAKTNAVEAARKQFEVKETARRIAKEALETANDETSRASREELLKLAELESEIADVNSQLRKAEAVDARETVALFQQKIDFLTEKSVLAKEQIRFTEEELNQRLAELEQLETDTKAEIHAIGLRQWLPEQHWQDAIERLDAASNPAARDLLAEEAEAWRLARMQVQEELLVNNQRLQLLAKLRQVWQRRHKIYNSELEPAELKLWREETDEILKDLAADLRVRNAQFEQARNLLTTLQTKLETAPPEAGSERARWLKEQETQLAEMLRTYWESISFMERTKRLHERLIGDLSQGEASLTWSQWAWGMYEEWLKVWNYEIGNVDDRPITVRKIVLGFLVVFVGFWFANFISRLVEKRIFAKNVITKDTAAVFRTLLFYSMLVMVIVIALWWVNVPVTVFTFLGGALAIGFGLGSQNLVNNFLSGLVIMTERPVRLGERICFGQYDGIVEEVGYRCTKLRTLTGHLVTIPNSQLVNEQVENIERRPYIRRSFDIGIPYDTERAKVAEAVDVLKAILEEEGIREPIHATIGHDYLPPRVFFRDYNSDNLGIWVIYWYSPPWFWDYMEHAERVNFRIMEEFERIGVEFAFPTQKVYFEQEGEVSKRVEPPR